MGWWPWPTYSNGTQLQSGYTVENNLVTSGTFERVKGVINDLIQEILMFLLWVGILNG